MKLYIDTSNNKQIEVRLLKSEQVVDQTVEQVEFGSQRLLPLIKSLLNKNNLKFEDLTEVEVSTGPGSFTGLRVGAAVAQALGFSLNIPVNGKLNSLVDLTYQ